MSGKRSISQYQRRVWRDVWSIPAWMVEQDARSKNPRAARANKSKSRGKK